MAQTAKDFIWMWKYTVARNFLAGAASPMQQKVYKTWIPKGDSRGSVES